MTRRAATLALLCWRAGPVLAASQLVATVLAGLLPSATVWATKTLVDGLAAGRPERVLAPVAGLVVLGLVAGCCRS